MLFALLVVLGFLFQFLAALPVKSGGVSLSAVAWGCWLAASVIWALPALHG